MNESRPIPAPAHAQPHAPHPPQAPHSPHAPGYQAPHPPPMRPGLAQPSAAGVGRAVVPQGTHVPTEKELEPISLIDDGDTATATAPASAPKKIVAIGADYGHKKHDWKRTTFRTGTGACRVKSFHGKYSEQGLEYLDNAINEWLDAHDDVEVKFVTSTVMTFEGKIREPALVLNVWY